MKYNQIKVTYQSSIKRSNQEAHVHSSPPSHNPSAYHQVKIKCNIIKSKLHISHQLKDQTNQSKYIHDMRLMSIHRYRHIVRQHIIKSELNQIN